MIIKLIKSIILKKVKIVKTCVLKIQSFHVQQSNIKKHLPNQFFSYQQNIHFHLIYILYIYIYICIYKRIKSKYEYLRKLYIQKYLYIFPFFFPLILKYIPYTLYTFSCEEKLVSSFLNKFCVTVLKISNVCSATSKKEKNVQAQGWPGAIIL